MPNQKIKILECETPQDGVIRWAVGKVDGPRSSAWRLWCNKKGDVYISTRQLGGTIKASLHRDGNCQVGFTSEYAETARRRFSNDGSRHWHKWKLPDLPLVEAIQIVLPVAELREFQPADESSKLFWVPTPALNFVSVVTIYIVARNVYEVNLPENSPEVRSLGIIPTDKHIALAVYSSNVIDDKTRSFIEEKRTQVIAGVSNFDEANKTGLRIIIFGDKDHYCKFFLELALDSAS